MNSKLAILLIMVAFRLAAQEVNMQHYDVKDGLANASYFDMYQDHTGRIWFGSDIGMYSYDGDKFKHYTIADGLPDNNILSFHEDKKQRLWLANYYGHLAYIKNDAIHSSLTKELPNTPGSFPIFMISENKEGNITFSYTHGSSVDGKIVYLVLSRDNKSIVKVPYNFRQPKPSRVARPVNLNVVFNSPKVFHNSRFNAADSQGRMTNTGHFIDINNKGQVGKISSDGIEVYTNDGAFLTSLKFKAELVNTRLIFEKENIWVSQGSKGIDLYKLQNNKITFISKFLAGITVNDVMCDKNNHTWFSTNNNGIYKLESTEAFIKTTSFGDNKLNKIAVFDPQAIFLSTNIMELRKVSNFNKVISVGNPLSRDNIVSLTKKGDELWFSGFTAGVVNKNGAMKPISHFPFDKYSYIKKSLIVSNQLWFYNRGYILKYENDKFINTELIKPHLGNTLYQFLIDSNGTQYFNTKLGLSVVEKDTNYQVSVDQIAVPAFTLMEEIKPGVILIGTNGSGLFLLKNGKLHPQLTSQRRQIGDIGKKCIVKNDTVFVLTDLGINILSYRNKKLNFTAGFTTKNSFFQNDIIDFDVCNDSIYAIDRKSMHTFASNYPTAIQNPYLFCRFLEDNRIIKAETEFPIVLKTETIFFENHELLQKEYRLNDDMDWTPFSGENLAINSLDYGSYEPEIRVLFGGGEVTCCSKIFLEVTAPFYQKRWFQIIVLMVVLVSVFQYRNRQKSKALIREIEQLWLNQKLNKLELQANQATMNPHFLFNILTSIQYFINANDKTQANKFISKFSKLIRFNLDAVHEGYVTIEKETEFLSSYLELESLRLQKTIKFEVNIDEELEIGTDRIPSMMLQPFLENSVWHGFTNDAVDSPQIDLSIKLITDDKIAIIVTDNGIIEAKNNQPHNGKALILIKERLNGFSETRKAEFKFKAESTPSKGYSIYIELPLVYS